jgi:DNA-directed RNA polymerase subunit M/transcription elongation factor TFIIS
MKFCTQCDNMYYIAVSETDTNKLTYYCRNCGHTDNAVETEGVTVLKTQFKKAEQKFNHIVNPYTKLDPTLPRITNGRCPNAACPSNATTNPVTTDILYIRYDDDQLKYLYMCVICDTTWKTEDAK